MLAGDPPAACAASLTPAGESLPETASRELAEETCSSPPQRSEP